MIERFHPYAEILRKLGNFRHSYIIFVTEAAKDSEYSLKVFQNLSVKYVTDNEINHQELLEFDEQIIVYTITDLENIEKHPELLLYANEFQMTKSEFDGLNDGLNDGLIDSLRGFSEVKNENGIVIVAAKVISYNNSIALKAPKKFMINETNVEPFHVIIYDARHNFAMLVIWDTREIVAIETNLSHERKNEILSIKHVNDSSRLLYIWNEIATQLKTEQPLYSYLLDNYIINIINQY